jgi:hypothetical protein
MEWNGLAGVGWDQASCLELSSCFALPLGREGELSRSKLISYVRMHEREDGASIQRFWKVKMSVSLPTYFSPRSLHLIL